MWFVADPAHLYKNINAGLQANETATLPQDFVKKYNLPTGKFNVKHLQAIVNADKENDYKLSPKLKEEHLNITKDHFGKMRVGNARAILCESNVSALQYLAHEDPADERLSTAQTLKIMYKWFDAMCSRNKNLAMNYKDKAKFNKQIKILEEAVDFITNLRVGANED